MPASDPENPDSVDEATATGSTLEQSTPAFSDFDLAAPIQAAIRDAGYEAPSAIQARAIPVLLKGHDIVGQAQTGTGKTAAFALPLLSGIDPDLARPQLLILTPTRELAIQVGEACQVYARHLKGLRVLPIYGGQGIDTQLRALKRGVQVVVGTPGRLMDHLERRSLKLDSLRAIVLDEADEMLNMGFLEDVEWILDKAPARKQTALFSATMPAAIRRIARDRLKEPVEIKIESKTSTVATITQRFWPVAGLRKMDALTRVLETEDFDAMLIFVRTKHATVELSERIEARGYSCGTLNGDMNQNAREQTIERLKKGALDIVVATDVAARGLDVERVSHVLNFDIPHDTESYVHRIGRTGRAGRSGQAILFVAPREKRMLRSIERATGQPLTEMRMPSRADVADMRVQRFRERIGTALVAGEQLEFFEDLIESLVAEHDVSARRIAAVTAYLLQKDQPIVPVAEPEKKSRKGDKTKKNRAERADKRERVGKAERSDRSERTAPPARAESDAAPERKPSSEKQSKKAQTVPGGLDMVRYRVDVGRDHGAEAKHIVGAITGEAGLDGQYIGPIQINDDHATVDLPAGMPKQILQILKRARVQGQKLGMKLLGPAEAPLKKRGAKKPAGPKGKPARKKPAKKTKKPKK